ncbi:MAG: zinc ribbon domain-containing protein [Chloroflexi bacterium]|nr:zinc ribbon domain-containing protein [Chloroflexota bacterium]
MTIPLTILALLIVLLAVVVILSPFLRPEEDKEMSELEGRQQQLESERFSALALLRDLELDYNTGKLSAADYQRLKGRYTTQAVAVLQALDQLQVEAGLPQKDMASSLAASSLADPASSTLDISRVLSTRIAKLSLAEQVADEIEREIAALRAQIAVSPAASTGALHNGAACPTCSAPVRPGDLFCPHCGESLATVPLVCTHCGAEMQPEDRFCAKCGRAR